MVCSREGTEEVEEKDDEEETVWTMPSSEEAVRLFLEGKGGKEGEA